MRICNLLLLLLLLPGWIAAITHTVKLDGSGDYSSIQAALDASVPGDTVLVHPGTYYENVSIQTNNISLISLEAITGNPDYIESTVIDGTRTTSVVQVGQNRQNVNVRGFTITNGLGNGINFGPSSIAFLSNCHITNNTASQGGGVAVAGATVTLSGVSVYNNYAVNFGGGLYASAATNYLNNITFDQANRCSIYNNRAGSGQDIYIQNAVSDLNVYLDTFSVAEPTTYYAIYRPEGSAEYQMNIDVLNAHHQEIDCDLFVSPEGDDANDGLSPATALRTIHEGIYRIAADSLNQKTVHLLPGIYSRAANNQVFPIALKSWTILQGNGTEATDVIGSPHPLLPTSYGSADAVFRTSFQPVSSISDLTITTQNTDNDTCITGVMVGALNLTNVRIHDVHPNWISSISVWFDGEHESFWDNVIIENVVTTRGLVSIQESVVDGGMSGKISNSIFRNSTSTYTSTSVWADPLVRITGKNNLIFENCEFSNLTMLDDNSNAIQVGGVQFPEQSNNFAFNNCMFSNISSPGGIMVAASSNNPNISFTNCTFADNESDTYTLQVNGNVNITNSIFDNDTPYQIKVNPMAGLNETTLMNIDYSSIKDGLAGIQQAAGNTINYAVTNIDSDPLFRGGDIPTDPMNYSLSELSPCIDTGTPDITGLDLLPYDLAWNWRVWNGRIDMGCYEYGSEPWVSNDDPVVPVPNEVMSVYPNPFRSFANIRVELDDAMQNARIEVNNLRGQKVKSIALDASGKGQSWWDGRDDSGKLCANGVYVLSLSVDNRVIQSKRVTLLR